MKIKFKFIIKICLLVYLIDLFIYDKIGSTAISFQDLISTIAFPFVMYYLWRDKKLFKKFTEVYALYFFYIILASAISSSIVLPNNQYYFYILKEIIFYLIMVIAYMNAKTDIKSTMKILEYFIIVNIIYGMYSFISQNIGYYGIGSIVSKYPSQSGIIYFGCSILSYFLYIQHDKKIKYLGYLSVSILLVFLTVSRTAIFGLMIFFMILVFIKFVKFIKRKFVFLVHNRNNLYLGISVFALLISLMLIVVMVNMNFEALEISDNYFVKMIEHRLLGIKEAAIYRRNRLEMFNYNGGNRIIKTLIGMGKGSPEILIQQSTLAVDNQFYRNYLEMGIIGIVIWLGTLLKTIRNAKLAIDPITVNLSIALLISYMAMGLSFEVFQVTKSGSMFWLLQGLFLGGSDTKRDIRRIHYKEYRGAYHESC